MRRSPRRSGRSTIPGTGVPRPIISTSGTRWPKTCPGRPRRRCGRYTGCCPRATPWRTWRTWRRGWWNCTVCSEPTGSLYLHCDPTMSHYLKLLLDAVFGAWQLPQRDHLEAQQRAHTPQGASTARFTMSSCSTREAAITRGTACPVALAGDDRAVVQQRRAGHGAYVQAGRPDGAGHPDRPSGQPWRGINPTDKGRHWAIPGFTGSITVGMPAQQALRRTRRRRPGIFSAKAGGRNAQGQAVPGGGRGHPRARCHHRHPAAAQHGRRADWLPTEKPVALLERIIAASSNRDDMVLDPVPAGWRDDDRGGPPARAGTGSASTSPTSPSTSSSSGCETGTRAPSPTS